eukprot:gene8129-biopygen19613
MYGIPGISGGQGVIPTPPAGLVQGQGHVQGVRRWLARGRAPPSHHVAGRGPPARPPTPSFFWRPPPSSSCMAWAEAHGGRRAASPVPDDAPPGAPMRTAQLRLLSQPLQHTRETLIVSLPRRLR